MPATSSTKPLRILVLSDTHSALPHAQPPPEQPTDQHFVAPSHSPFTFPFPTADLALHCGDLTLMGTPSEHARAISLLRSLPAPVKVVIPGNHDLTLDREYCGRHARLKTWERDWIDQDLDHVRAWYESEEARGWGLEYLVEGTRSVVLDGKQGLDGLDKGGRQVRVYANAYTPEFMDWGFAYPKDVDRFNLPQLPGYVPSFQASDTTQIGGIGKTQVSDSANNRSSSGMYVGEKQNDNVDIMVTHGPPYGILDQTTKGEHVGCPHLRRAVERARPLIHCFGHIHEAWGVIRKSWVSGEEKVLASLHDTGTEGRAGAAMEEIEGVEMTDRGVLTVDAADLVLGEETLFVNASIMDHMYRPAQRSVLVELKLPDR